MTLKRHTVVMLATNQKAPIVNYQDKTLYLFRDDKIDNYKETKSVYQHLYILSDEEIKEGDWFEYKGLILKDDGAIKNVEGRKKVVATTDSSLVIKTGPKPFGTNGDTIYSERLFPTPSQQFIEKYVEKYNKGQQITEVMVEYAPDYIDYPKDMGGFMKLKVDKNNTITIKPVKDSWSREEVTILLRRIASSVSASRNYIKNQDDFDKWIEQNL